MATILDKYETLKEWIGEQIAATEGYDNVTVYYGDPTAKLAVPSARVSLAEPLETSNESFQLFYTGAINVGITALFTSESEFLAGLSPFIETLDANAANACGIEIVYVSQIEFSSEDEKYSRATIKVSFQSYK